MDDTLEAERERLVQELQQAARNLLRHTSTESMIFPIDGLTPPRYIVIGDNLALKRLCGIINSPFGHKC
jgi:hypothetical protein